MNKTLSPQFLLEESDQALSNMHVALDFKKVPTKYMTFLFDKEFMAATNLHHSDMCAMYHK